MAYTPVLRKEVVSVEPLGEVVVRMLKLSERLALRSSEQPADTFAPRLLAMTVTDKQGDQLLDAEGWDVFGAEHTGATNALLEVAMRLSGMGGGDEAKNA